MKCFPDLGSCCRPISAAPSRQREEDEAMIHYLASLHSSSSTRRHAKRMRRLGAAGSGGSQNWKPGLQAIREEGGVGFDSDGKIMNSRSQSKASPHKSKDRYNIRRVSQLDDIYYSRSNSSPMFLPAFSPTPFMF
ncbi:hypothetical protein COLO4_13028 [Corchorus olitorius]|uniref:Uncharacterized protein n=1 Tax=Corchorus olitorius TaxID=93759 RepID=A0A1R3JYJ0_9ROSI|nr:hypothetical protein COLO4_13028 [Corchorus olitorius]